MPPSGADASVRPWQLLLELVEGETTDPAWNGVAPAPGAGGGGRPLLDGVTIQLDGHHLQGWTGRLLDAAAENGGPASTLAGGSRRLDLLVLLRAALTGDSEQIGALAHHARIDHDALAAVAPLLPVPLLRACGAAWAPRVAPDWGRGHCPVCGSWPTLAEARGLERTRQLRCGSCGGDWRLSWLTCPFCDNAEHDRLPVLAPAVGGELRKVEACSGCGAYIKTFTTLTARSPADVLLGDLASIDLDVAALQRGYHRPQRPAVPLDVRLVLTEPRAWGLLARR